jgi:hypothetical protein
MPLLGPNTCVLGDAITNYYLLTSHRYRAHGVVPSHTSTGLDAGPSLLLNTTLGLNAETPYGIVTTDTEPRRFVK